MDHLTATTGAVQVHPVVIQKSYFQFLTFSAIIILMTYLVFGLPFTKANNQHTK